MTETSVFRARKKMQKRKAYIKALISLDRKQEHSANNNFTFMNQRNNHLLKLRSIFVIITYQ